MKAKKTVLGLLTFLCYLTSGNLPSTLMACSVVSILFLITGNSEFHMVFIGLVMAMPPYIIMTSVAGSYASKLERFQTAMPVKRKDIILSQYIGIIIVSIAAIPFIGIITAVSIALHENLREIIGEVVSSTAEILSLSFGIALLTGALFFPLVYTKIGKNRGEGFVFVCMIASIGIVVLVTQVGAIMNLSRYSRCLLDIAVSAAAFIFSYYISRNLYAKLDL